MKTPTLQTGRLILRPISLDDAPAVQKYFNDWDIIKYISNAPWPYPEDGALCHIRDTVLPEMERGDGHTWVIIKGHNDVIGMVNYRLIAGENNDNRGFWLAVPYHGQGLMTEAVHAVNDFIFNVLKVDCFYVRNVKGNIGSHRVKLKTGGRIIGECEDALANGNTEIMELWEITKQDWEQSKKNLKL